MRQLFNIRFVAAVAALAGLAFLVNALFAADDPIDAIVDVGTVDRRVDLMEPVFATTSSPNFRKNVDRINRALAKFDVDEFGLCEGTEEPIGYRRLKLVPWARYSVAYKEQLELEQIRKTARRAGR